jgi:SAM-dependent methyltransferase
VAEREAVGPDAPLSQLPPQVKAERSQSFGTVAADYERYRPTPPSAAVDWLLPEHRGRVVDLGAGTGRLTQLLVDRADEVVAIEPDERMRAVLEREVPGARAVDGRGESIPLPDGSVDAVLASSSWHWMDSVPTLSEVARVLVPGGVLGVMWTGAARMGRAISKAEAVHNRLQRPAHPAVGTAPSATRVSRRMMDEVLRPEPTFEIPPGHPFDVAEHEEFRYRVALDADELVGLLGTSSWVLTLPDDERATLIAETRSYLAEVMGIQAQVKAEVPFATNVWRAHRLP